MSSPVTQPVASLVEPLVSDQREAFSFPLPQGAYGAGNPMLAYQRAQVLGASPMRLVLMLYDLALAGCGRRDETRARRAVTELIAGLNFDYEEIAVALFRLYEYCLGAIRSGDFEEASKILSALKEAWETALRDAPAA